MNKLIALTGKMGSGKTTLLNKIKGLRPNYIYIEVDEFRYNLFNNTNYLKELKNIIKELKNENKIDSNILNKYIYKNKTYMKEYKKVLYKYLFNYINTFNNKIIIVEWSLILVDKLDSLFDKIIIIDEANETIIKRLESSPLERNEILKRLKLQEVDLSKYKSCKYLILKERCNMKEVIDFIEKVNCKFTIPKESKCVWEITHNCNYSCKYCMFSCGRRNVRSENLSTEECYKILDELHNNGFKHLKITGGEPFLRKDIIDILDYASKYFVTDISTNASLITKEDVERLNKINLKMIHVSLDGTKTSHDSVRGIGSFEKTIRGLELLKNSKNKIRIGTVINKNNENDLESIVKLAVSLEADEIIFSIMEPFNEEDKYLYKTRDNIELLKEIEELNKKYKDKIIVNSNFKETFNNVTKCPGLDKMLYIDNKGCISPCAWACEKNKNLLTKQSLANKSLKELTKEKEMQEFIKNKESGKCYGEI